MLFRPDDFFVFSLFLCAATWHGRFVLVGLLFSRSPLVPLHLVVVFVVAVVVAVVVNLLLLIIIIIIIIIRLLLLLPLCG